LLAKGRSPLTGRPQNLKDSELRGLLERHRVLEDGAIERVVTEDFVDHAADHLPLLRRRVEGFTKPPITKERDAGDRVVQIGERRDRKNVPSDFLSSLLDCARKLLPAVAACPAGKEPEVTLRGERREQTRQLCVSLLLSPRGPLVDLPRGRVHGRHGVVAGLDLDISLRDLLRVVEGMAVEKCPQKLTRYVLDGELEMGMLERRVVAGAVDRAGQSVAPV